MGLISQVKSNLKLQPEGTRSRLRFVEPKESLACQKLLYPSKFRKDPYRQHKEETNTKLPSITKQRANNAQMLQDMLGVKEKRFPRQVSEAALKFIHALDRGADL